MKNSTRKKTANEICIECIGASDCKIITKGPLPTPEIMHIIFSGKLAALPSLKNSKLPGKNFHCATTAGKLHAMTRLYKHRAGDLKVNFGKKEIYLHVALSKYCKVDEDNAYASIRDWLEPFNKRDRGWGIGIIENDAQITGEARACHRIGLDLENTIITIRPLDLIKDEIERFTQKIMGDAILWRMN